MAWPDCAAAIVGNALIATLLTLAAVAIGRWGKNPPLAHALCVLALAKLVTPPLFELPWLPGGSTTPTDIPVTFRPELALAYVPPPSAPPSAIEPVMLLFGVWLLGSLTLLGRAAWRCRRFAGLLRTAELAPAGLCAEANRLAQRLGLLRAPRLTIIAAPISPALCSSWRGARLLLPKVLLSRVPAEERAALLLHELAHLRRRDHWVRWLEFAVAVVWWWLPTVWLLRRTLRHHEEQCCDAWVVWALPGRERAYAGALLSTIDFLADATLPLPVHASGVGPVHHLKTRLTMIMTANTHRRVGPIGQLTIAVAALALPVLPTPAQDKPTTTETKTPTTTTSEAGSTEARLNELEALVKKLLEERGQDGDRSTPALEWLLKAKHDQAENSGAHGLMLEALKKAQADADQAKHDHSRKSDLNIASAEAAERAARELDHAKLHHRFAERAFAERAKDEQARKLAEAEHAEHQRQYERAADLFREEQRDPRRDPEDHDQRIEDLRREIAGLQDRVKALQAELVRLGGAQRRPTGPR